MSFPISDLMAGESVVCEAHPSWWNHAGDILLGVLLTPVFGIGLLVLAGAWIDVAATCYTVTNKRVIAKTGWLNTRRTEVRIEDIRGVTVGRTFWQRVFGIGDVEIGSAATAGVEIRIRGVAEPERLMKTIGEQR